MPYKITSATKGISALCDTNHGAEYFNTLFDVSDCVVELVPNPTIEEIAGYAAISAKKSCCIACEKLMDTKLSVGFVYGGNTYQITGASREAIGQRAIYAWWSNADPVTFPWSAPYSLGWWDVSNVWHAMTSAEFMVFAKAVSDYVSACFACCRTHKNAIGAICDNALLTDQDKITAMEAYLAADALTGWPVNP